MPPTPNKTFSKPGSKRAPVAAAPTIDVGEALNDAVAWWDEFDALVDLDLGDALEQVLATARALHLPTVRDLHHDAARVIGCMSGVAAVSRFTDAATANALHQARNAVAAITLVTEVRHGTNPFGPYDLIAALPHVAPRHGGKCRPATDDEILLTRSSAIHSLMRGGRYTLGANQYTLAESGAHPMETTAVRPCDFDSVAAPSSVRLRGDTWYYKRRVSLTPFARRALAVGVDAYLARRPGAHQSPLCFDGSGKGSASASSSNNLKHLAERVGITAPSLEGSYATRWRAHKELRDVGEHDALRLIGKYNPESIEMRRLYDFLNQPPQPVIIEVDENDDDDLRNCG